jgi:hypothetical protein
MVLVRNKPIDFTNKIYSGDSISSKYTVLVDGPATADGCSLKTQVRFDQIYFKKLKHLRILSNVVRISHFPFTCTISLFATVTAIRKFSNISGIYINIFFFSLGSMVILLSNIVNKLLCIMLFLSCWIIMIIFEVRIRNPNV